MTKIRISLDIEVEPYTEEQLLEADFPPEEAYVKEVDSDDVQDVGRALASYLNYPETMLEALAGSECFVNVHDVRFVGGEVLA